ncbi:MAG: class I SAM-dependent methyltransferase [Spirochaetales bacterium]|nr:class I SAM-dependent methyltransferase [Spirochaetales bacterium]
METLGANPAGILGRLAGNVMNLMHARWYRAIIRNEISNAGLLTDLPAVLDLGCGGGKTLGLLAVSLPEAKVFGVDHSPDMVRLAGRVNRKTVSAGRIEVRTADVCSLPFPDAFFDLVTAFDTINFWEDLPRAVVEVLRVLKPGGRFFIVNGYPKEGTRWYDFVKFKNKEEYRRFLGEAGFRSVDAEVRKNTVIVSAQK